VNSFPNPFELPGQWYRANLHAHTTTSDGRISPAERVEQYRAEGYHVLALTDHEATNDVTALAGGEMLVIGGVELHPPDPAGESFHLVGLHVPFGFADSEGEDANECIARVRAAGGIVILAHPYWCGQAFQDFAHLRGLSAVEVYNGTCDYAGRPCSENEWAYALDHGAALPAVGVDDCHLGLGGVDVFAAWTWLRMPAVTAENVLAAVSQGACYASCGPVVEDFRLAGGQVRLGCSPAAKIQFLSGRAQGVTRWADPGQTIRDFTVDRPNWPYVRAVVTDPSGRRAWTNPLTL
jgi:hypothetical protein